MRDLDYVNQWGIVETSTSKANWKRFWEHHEGTHAILFTYVDRTAGMSSWLEIFCNRQSDGSFVRVGGPVDNKAVVTIRYGTFPISEITLLTTEQRQALGLSERPDWLKHYDDGSMDELRKMALLDPLRAPGFPDDIKFIIGRAGFQPEQVWGRIHQGIIKDGILGCELLNEPSQNMGIHRGDSILLVVSSLPNGAVNVGFVGKVGEIPTKSGTPPSAKPPAPPAIRPSTPPEPSPLDKLKNLFKRCPQ
jgi:hypothetical protein